MFNSIIHAVRNVPEEKVIVRRREEGRNREMTGLIAEFYKRGWFWDTGGGVRSTVIYVRRSAVYRVYKWWK